MTEVKQKPIPNKEQQAAIDTYKREGTFLVLAGPGTGKTFTVSQRIKAIIEAGTPPERILCLTFSDTAASEMKKGIEKALNIPNSSVNIYTYHGFCFETIKNNPDIFGIGENIKIITDSIKKAFMKECIDELLEQRSTWKEPTTFKTEKSGPYFFIDTILSRIEEIKKYRLDEKKYNENLKNNPDWIPLVEEKTALWEKSLIKNPDKPKTAVLINAEKKVAKAQEVWELYKFYKLKMQRKNFLDFGDMIAMVLDKFESSESFAKEIASKYDYIIADEYQDTNVSQNEILFSLAKNMEKKNVFVVGDDDQIIYTFQGARLDSVKNFITKLNVKDTDVICFKDNRRSTSKILELARQIVLQDDISLEKDSYFKRFNISKELNSVNEELVSKNKNVECTIYRDTLQERINIVESIKNLINSPDCPKDENGEKKLYEIAVLARTNEELEQYAKLLQGNNIPYETKYGKNVFDIQSFVMCFMYMKFLCNSTFNSDAFFKMILSKPFEINERDYEVLYRTRNLSKSFVENIRKYKENGYKYKKTNKNGEEEERSFVAIEKADRFLRVYDELKELKQCTDLKDAVITIGNKTGIFAYYFNSPINRSENIAGIKKLVDEAQSYSELERPCTFEGFVEYLEKTMNDGIKIYADKPPVKQNSVKLVTYHGSKGMEFEYVYMPYLIKKQVNFESPSIPLSIQDDISKDNQTGADISKEQKDAIKKSNLIKLTYVAMTRAKHSLNLSWTKVRDDGKDSEPLELLTTDVVKELINPKEYETEEKSENYEEEIIKSLSVCDRDYQKEFNDYLNCLLSEKTFSVSAINCYLGCSREYLYTHLLALSPKEGDADKAYFGTAVHAAYEFAVKTAIETGNFPSKELFIDKFEHTLSELPVSSKLELKRMLNDGMNILSKPDEEGECAYDRLRMTPAKQFYQAEYGFEFDIDGSVFNGKIDRIDKLPGGKYIIYDYKTGDRKGEKEICLEGVHEDYYNQMAIYKHFLRKDLNCDYDDISTVFIFPRSFKQPFELKLTKEDCEERVEKFQKAIREIKSLKFEPKTNKADCNIFCPYRNSYCSLNII